MSKMLFPDAKRLKVGTLTSFTNIRESRCHVEVLDDKEEIVAVFYGDSSIRTRRKAEEFIEMVRERQKKGD